MAHASQPTRLPLVPAFDGEIFGWQTMAAVPPNAGLIVDDSGNLYGTTTEGGDRDYNGTVFRLHTIGGMFTVLFKFGGYAGSYPFEAWFEIQRDLYDTTVGAHSNGVVFQLNLK
jgi:uncharacterized repeat protein (TIGR03803 family)